MILYVAFNAGFGIGPGRGAFTEWLFMDFIGTVFFGLGSAYCVKLIQEQREREAKTS
jgi:hypothetical protein